MKRAFALCLCLCAVALTAQADTLRVPVGQQAGHDVQRPTSGMNKSRVLESFGEPAQRKAAVGEPPISSWEYADYVVYFEGDVVLHSVLKHRPQASSN